MYFGSIVRRDRCTVLRAIVTKVMDRSIEVALVDFDRTSRVYLCKNMPFIRNLYFERLADGSAVLYIDWKQSLQEKGTNPTFKSPASSDGEIEILHCRRRTVIRKMDMLSMFVSVEPKDVSKLRVYLRTPIEEFNQQIEESIIGGSKANVMLKKSMQLPAGELSKAKS